MIQPADRVEYLPPYLFARIDRLIEEKKKAGVDVISLGIGDPVEPTPEEIIEALDEALKDPENHRYPSYFGLREFRQAAAVWMKNRFGVELDPDREILPVIGSKEGIAHLTWAMAGPGDAVLVPDPAYPVYRTSAILAGARPVDMPLLKENDFLIDLDAVPSEVLEQAKLMYLNYPNNPTSATASMDFFRSVIEFAARYNIAVAHDNAYSEITFNGYVAPSILQVDGAKEVAVEFHSLSKSFNMTGWRIGFVAGNADIIDALGRLKTNIDSGIFNPIQYAGIKALLELSDFPRKMVEIYSRRRQLLTEFLESAGIDYHRSDATIYIWAQVPRGETSESFATLLLEKAGVVVSPGSAYGRAGEGYVRMSLTVPDNRLKEAVERLKQAI